MGIKSGEWSAVAAMRVHVHETARRKIVKPIRPTNLYNVVRHFYRLATPLANTPRGGRKKSFHTLGDAARLRAHRSFSGWKWKILCCRERSTQRVHETALSTPIVTRRSFPSFLLRQLCIKGLTNHNLSPPLSPSRDNKLSLSRFSREENIARTSAINLKTERKRDRFTVRDNKVSSWRFFQRRDESERKDDDQFEGRGKMDAGGIRRVVTT